MSSYKLDSAFRCRVTNSTALFPVELQTRQRFPLSSYKLDSAFRCRVTNSTALFPVELQTRQRFSLSSYKLDRAFLSRVTNSTALFPVELQTRQRFSLSSYKLDSAFRCTRTVVQLSSTRHFTVIYFRFTPSFCRRIMENHQTEANRNTDKKEENVIGLDTHCEKKQEQ